jgi:REP element-mobilizing transposase RayT
MARPLRFLPYAWCPLEVTTRTMQGRFLLRPSPEVNARILGVLARAQSKYDVRLFHCTVMSNHMHLLLATDSVATLAQFMSFVNGNIAREIGRLHGWPGRFWARRYRAIPVLDDDALLDRFRYLMAQGVKEGLVRRPTEWPGVHFADALRKGTALEGTWYDRSSVRGSGQSPRVLHGLVKISPLPIWAELDERERRQNADEIAQLVTREGAEGSGAIGHNPLGRRRILAQDPHGSPADHQSKPAPPCHASSLAEVRLFRAAYADFVLSYRTANQELIKVAKELAQLPRGLWPPGSAGDGWLAPAFA